MRGSSAGTVDVDIDPGIAFMAVRTELNEKQYRRLETLGEKMPNCRVIGYRYWDLTENEIIPLIQYPDGKLAELRPNGRLSVIDTTLEEASTNA